MTKIHDSPVSMKSKFSYEIIYVFKYESYKPWAGRFTQGDTAQNRNLRDGSLRHSSAESKSALWVAALNNPQSRYIRRQS